MPSLLETSGWKTTGAPSETEGLDHVVTEKGSVYTYLPDGRTQRHKTASDQVMEPRDALVFVPDYEWLKANAPRALLSRIGVDERGYEETLVSYMQDKGKTTMIVDEKGQRTETNESIANSEGQVILAFIDKTTKKTDFVVPVSKTPRLGWYAYDTRDVKTRDVLIRQRHLGHKVTEIVKKK